MLTKVIVVKCVRACVRVCMHACMHAYMCACMVARVHICVRICVDICVHVCVHVCVCMYALLCVCNFVCVKLFVRASHFLWTGEKLFLIRLSKALNVLQCHNHRNSVLDLLWLYKDFHRPSSQCLPSYI